MIIVTGTDARSVARLSRGLKQRGFDVQVTAGDDVIAERSFLFMLAMQLKSRGVVVWDVADPGPMRDRLLGHAIASTSAACAGPLVLVTNREIDDPMMKQLRSDGVPYAVLRIPARLCDVVGLGAHLQGRHLMLPKEVAAALDGAAPFTDCVDAVVSALADDANDGRIHGLQETGCAAFQRLIERAGVRVEVVNGLRVRMAGWLGQPFARMKGNGDLEIVCERGEADERPAA
jgi:hypothetical protein